MSVVWSATSTESGAFSPLEIETEFGRLSDRFRSLRAAGEGYLEVRLAGRDYPQLTLGFHDEQAIVHQFASPDVILLLSGDATVPAAQVIEVPILNELVEFSGGFVVCVERAWNLIDEFARTGKLDGWGDWCDI